jgi:ribosomal protein L4
LADRQAEHQVGLRHPRQARHAVASATVVTTAVDRNLCLSLRNVPLVDVCTVADLNARQVLLRRYLVLTPAALAALEQRFAKKES